MIKFLFIFYLLISPFLVHASHCHPLINKFKKKYIIGYGSLISESSKKNTYLNTGVNIPVEVSGYKRSFCVQNYFNKTYPNAVFLGVQKNKSEKFRV